MIKFHYRCETCGKSTTESFYMECKVCGKGVCSKCSPALVCPNCVSFLDEQGCRKAERIANSRNIFWKVAFIILIGCFTSYVMLILDYWVISGVVLGICFVCIIPLVILLISVNVRLRKFKPKLIDSAPEQIKLKYEMMKKMGRNGSRPSNLLDKQK